MQVQTSPARIEAESGVGTAHEAPVSVGRCVHGATPRPIAAGRPVRQFRNRTFSVAYLVAQAASPSAASAQRRFNTLIDSGMKTARGVAGLDARAIDYSVGPIDDKHTSWSAQQTLELRGADAPTLRCGGEDPGRRLRDCLARLAAVAGVAREGA